MPLPYLSSHLVSSNIQKVVDKQVQWLRQYHKLMMLRSNDQCSWRFASCRVYLPDALIYIMYNGVNTLPQVSIHLRRFAISFLLDDYICHILHQANYFLLNHSYICDK
jgi:hypothetical protein